jgi:hypothetical protein
LATAIDLRLLGDPLPPLMVISKLCTSEQTPIKKGDRCRKQNVERYYCAEHAHVIQIRRVLSHDIIRNTNDKFMQFLLSQHLRVDLSLSKIMRT